MKEFSINAKTMETIIVLATVAMTVNCQRQECQDSEQCRVLLDERFKCWNGVCMKELYGRSGKFRPEPLKCQTSGRCIAALGKNYICINRICKKRPKSIKSRHPGNSIQYF